MYLQTVHRCVVNTPSRHKRWLVSATWACLLAGIATPAQAGNMYVFKDKSGNVLLTNVVGKNKKPKGKHFRTYSTKVKVTWYQDTNVHAYTDWGKSEASVLPSFSKNKNAYDAYILNSAERHGVDAALMKAIMHTESSFNPRARSPVGAQGLMQLMPATARRFSVTNVWNPQQNIEGSAKYLKYLKKRFSGNTSLMLAGYNAGEGNVAKYGGIPPFKETRNYVKKVLSRYRKLYKNNLNYGAISNASSITVFSPSGSHTKHATASSVSGRFAAYNNRTKRAVARQSLNHKSFNNLGSNLAYRSHGSQPSNHHSKSAYEASAFAALEQSRYRR